LKLYVVYIIYKIYIYAIIKKQGYENRKTSMVLGNAKKGFKVVTKRPRTKHVEEPHKTERGAYLWIANFYSKKA